MQIMENSNDQQPIHNQISSEELKNLAKFFATLLEWNKEEKQLKNKELK